MRVPVVITGTFFFVFFLRISGVSTQCLFNTTLKQKTMFLSQPAVQSDARLISYSPEGYIHKYLISVVLTL